MKEVEACRIGRAAPAGNRHRRGERRRGLEASIAAGWMVAQLARWLRGLPTDPDLTLNLLSSELAVE